MCDTFKLLFQTIALAVEFLVIIAANTITIVVFWKLRSVLKRTYYLLINLTVADLAVGFAGIVVMTSYILKLLNSTRDITWDRYIPMDVFSGTASLTSLLVIAGERFLAIVFPFRHRVLTKRFYMKCIAGVWITSILMAAIVLLPMVFDIPVGVTISRATLGSSTIVCLIVICSL